MNASDALARLVRLGVPVLQTADAAVALGQSQGAANKTLSRLADAGLVARVRHGAWWIGGDIDFYRLPEYLTAPYPSYVSLQTALHLRGLIEQIPEVLYAVSLARTQRTMTSAGTISFHHIAPELFGGFEEMSSPSRGVKLATAEKALFDLAYLSGGRSRSFEAVPELEIPTKFRWSELGRWVRRIPSARRRVQTTSRLERFLTRGASLRLAEVKRRLRFILHRGVRNEA
jgi:predicted transcriptional regulator of viral defense system